MVLRVSAVIGTKDYETTLGARDHTVLSDESSAGGGQDKGPGPSELMLMGLGACTSITLRMYAKRKGWDLQGVESELEMSTENGKSRIERRIKLVGPLEDSQRSRLLQIANACPVHKLLSAGVAIESSLKEA